MNLQAESAALMDVFLNYARQTRLPEALFYYPDHIALQATDISDFDQLVKEVIPEAEQVAVTEADDRFIAIAQLSGHLVFPNIGQIKWVEIIEPTVEEAKVGYNIGGHVEFYYLELEQALKWLEVREIGYQLEEEPELKVRVPYGSFGEELHLSRVSLGEIVQESIENGQARLVKKAA